MFSGDFVKLTASQGNGTEDDWSDQEILLLLEGVEMFDDDWTLIEEHVGTRSAQQCIRKFLELPIEDPYLEAESEGTQGALRYGRVPFDQADNPVMSVVAFLAGVVGPGVAAEAAKTALHELIDGDKNVTSAEGEKAEKEKEGSSAPVSTPGPEQKAGEAEAKDEDQTDKDAMVVDGEAPTAPASMPKSAIPHSKVQRAAHLALSASAKAARALADAEEVSIRSTLAQLIQLTLTRLELKTAQFEEMEEVLEEERRALAAQRLALANERANVKKVLEGVRAEIAKSTAQAQMQGSGMSIMSGGALAQAFAQQQQGNAPKATPVEAGVPMDADSGPLIDAHMQQIG